MNVVKLDKRKFKTKHVLYMIKCDELGGIYYIGKHTCTGLSYNCSKKKCNYSGSSSIMSSYYELMPDAKWIMSSLCFANDIHELKELELMHLSLHVGNPKCINQVIASSIKPAYTNEAKNKMRIANRAKSLEMIDLNGKSQSISVRNIKQALSIGYRIKRSNIKLKHDVHKVQVHLGTSNLHQVLCELLEDGWQIGEDRRLARINSAQFWQLAGYKKERIVITQIQKL